MSSNKDPSGSGGDEKDKDKKSTSNDSVQDNRFNRYTGFDKWYTQDRTSPSPPVTFIGPSNDTVGRSFSPSSFPFPSDYSPPRSPEAEERARVRREMEEREQIRQLRLEAEVREQALRATAAWVTPPAPTYGFPSSSSIGVGLGLSGTTATSSYRDFLKFTPASTSTGGDGGHSGSTGVKSTPTSTTTGGDGGYGGSTSVPRTPPIDIPGAKRRLADEEIKRKRGY